MGSAAAIAPHIFDPSKFNQHGPDQMDCNQVNSELQRRKIEPNSKFPEMLFLAELDGVPCFPQGDIVCIAGKAKHGKSFLALFILAALYKGSYGPIKARKKNIKAIFIDTEMSSQSAQDRLLKLYAVCGWDEKNPNPDFNYYCLRQDDYKTRRTIIKSALEEHRPDIVIIDGPRDLVQNFNDVADSADGINFVMQLTAKYKVTIICVLHTNKANDNMRGHYGAEFLAKSAEAYLVTKTGVSFKVEQTDSRNKPVSDWHFEINELGYPMPDELERRVDMEAFANLLIRDEFRIAFEQKEKYKYMELARILAPHVKGGLDGAKRLIAKGRELGFLETEKGFITLKKEDEN